MIHALVPTGEPSKGPALKQNLSKRKMPKKHPDGPNVERFVVEFESGISNWKRSSLIRVMGALQGAR